MIEEIYEARFVLCTFCSKIVNFSFKNETDGRSLNTSARHATLQKLQIPPTAVYENVLYDVCFH